MNCGVSTACFYPQLLEKTIDVLSKMGVQNLELFLNTFSEVNPCYVKELEKQIKENGQSVIALHPFSCAFEPFMFFTNYDRRFEDALEWYKQYFHAMNILGATIFIFHGDRKLGLLEDDLYFERFAKLRDIGKEFDIIVAQENVERCKSGDVHFLQKMIEYLDKDVSLVFDNKQAIRSNIDQELFVNKLGKNIVHVHLSDNNKVHDCLPIGEGTLDVAALMNQLKNLNYNGYFIQEIYSNSIKSRQQFFESYQNLLKQVSLLT
ncbi:sugar phosphate isomerase/epimerase [Paludicola sp. MB14-C6]|uniref:sugar phosphate isomerase/epimerase family protein n=1 Tax=Paludihabitans sp. MB14-C6 TaxID=3070656 RepID=UPI0027DD2961|nr:sugar phosphate isomerase/epimerase [Paludicola sp. MB14-C6]WMJ23501.1 sugar phosphate isomerase/epimerase [Paludicola sp. MB14-C6]